MQLADSELQIPGRNPLFSVHMNKFVMEILMTLKDVMIKQR